MSSIGPGTLLRGRYRLVRAVGFGGIGTVYESTDEALFGRAVAIKLLRDQALASRYRRELKALTSIRHPSVAVADDWGEADDGTLFEVHEMIHGKPLHQIAMPNGADPRAVAAMARSLAPNFDIVSSPARSTAVPVP